MLNFDWLGRGTGLPLADESFLPANFSGMKVMLLLQSLSLTGGEGAWHHWAVCDAASIPIGGGIVRLIWCFKAGGVARFGVGRSSWYYCPSDICRKEEHFLCRVERGREGFSCWMGAPLVVVDVASLRLSQLSRCF